jgi:hypothetical protein
MNGGGQILLTIFTIMFLEDRGTTAACVGDHAVTEWLANRIFHVSSFYRRRLMGFVGYLMDV